MDPEEGLKSESSALESPSPTHRAPVCDLSEPYASVMRSLAEKRVKENSSKIVQSSMSGASAGMLRYVLHDKCRMLMVVLFLATKMN